MGLTLVERGRVREGAPTAKAMAASFRRRRSRGVRASHAARGPYRVGGSPKVGGVSAHPADLQSFAQGATVSACL